MDNTFQKIPFLRITLAFALGIILGKHFQLSQAILIIGLAVLLIILVFLNLKFTFKRETVFGLFAPLFFVLLGTTFYAHKNILPTFYGQNIYVGTVLEKPQEKPNSYKSLIHLTSVKTNDTLLQTDETVLVYFAKTASIENLNPGSQILINAKPVEIQNFGTPFSFNYKSYLKNKQIYRQLYLNEENWRFTNNEVNNPFIQAELWREKLLNIYRAQNLGANETEILSALTLGYKRDLDPETKRVFSAAGAMHVLAVSGLHVGIIYLVFVFLFGFLRKQRTGRLIFVISSIMLLWLFAFITGLSPSVLRAATMFTIVIIGENNSRKSNIYNSLAVSALFLLLINSNNLFEVGFQLSYSAVFGIVFLQPRLFKLWKIENKIGKFFWGLLTVSIAAQISTFPLTAFYFNQFPTFFWFTNLIVIPAVTILIPLGLGLLLVSKIPILSIGVAVLVKGIINGVYSILVWIEALPHSVLDISIYRFELVLFITFIFFAFLFIKNIKAASLKWALVFLISFFLSLVVQNSLQLTKRELLVFNDTSNTTLLLIYGRNTYVISQNKIESDDFLFRQIVEVKRKKRLKNPVYLQMHDEFEDKFLYLKKGFVAINGKTICFDEKIKNYPSDFTPDYQITQQNLRFQASLNEKTKYITTKYASSNRTHKHLHSLKTQGVFYEKW